MLESREYFLRCNLSKKKTRNETEQSETAFDRLECKTLTTTTIRESEMVNAIVNVLIYGIFMHPRIYKMDSESIFCSKRINLRSQIRNSSSNDLRMVIFKVDASLRFLWVNKTKTTKQSIAFQCLFRYFPLFFFAVVDYSFLIFNLIITYACKKQVDVISTIRSKCEKSWTFWTIMKIMKKKKHSFDSEILNGRYSIQSLNKLNSSTCDWYISIRQFAAFNRYILK